MTDGLKRDIMIIVIILLTIIGWSGIVKKYYNNSFLYKLNYEGDDYGG